MRKINNVEEHYELAIYYAKKHIYDLYDQYQELDSKLDTAIYYLADGMAEKYSEKDAYRRAYQLVHHDDWLDHLPSEYMSDDEIDDRDNRRYQRNIGDDIANGDYHDLMLYELSRVKEIKGPTRQKMTRDGYLILKNEGKELH